MAPTKAWMRKENIYDNDLCELLIQYGVKDCPKDFKKVTQNTFDKIWRRGCVERFQELKDQASRLRLEKKMKKIEKVWRKQSGIKMTSIKGANKKKTASSSSSRRKQKSNNNNNNNSDRSRSQSRSRPRTQTKSKSKSNSKSQRKTYGGSSSQSKSKTNTQRKKKGGKSMELKKWMMKEGCWEQSLFKELKKNGVKNSDDIQNLSEVKFDRIVRKVRVERFSQLKDTTSRNRCDKVLVGFERKWRLFSGIKKTSIR